MADPGDACGVLGGSFDPVHFGHLHVAEELRRCLRLSRVLLLPAAVPPHKSGDQIAPAAHRRAMLELALRGRDGLELCTLELDRGGVTYTIDTLRSLRSGQPPLRPVFLLGSDLLAQLPSWRGWRDMVREFDLALAGRAGHALETSRGELHPEIAGRLIEVPADAAAVAALEPGRGGRIFCPRLAPVPISASEIRARAARGNDLAGLVPAPVAEYIQRSGLYRREAAR